MIRTCEEGKGDERTDDVGRTKVTEWRVNPPTLSGESTRGPGKRQGIQEMGSDGK